VAVGQRGAQLSEQAVLLELLERRLVVAPGSSAEQPPPARRLRLVPVVESAARDGQVVGGDPTSDARLVDVPACRRLGGRGRSGASGGLYAGRINAS
jgi:hypothetical protein